MSVPICINSSSLLSSILFLYVIGYTNTNIGLISLFDGISTFVGYLMSKPSL